MVDINSFSPKRYEEIALHPWHFLTKCIKTRDPQDLDNPVKRFPDYDYLKIITNLWMREKKILVPKSRRMMLSWLGQGLFLWDAMFNTGRDIGFVSKKEEDADELLTRTQFMIDNISEEDLPKDLRPKYKRTYKFLEFPEIGSRIMAFPSGSDQLRSYGLSGIMADEMGFWDDADKMYSASMPTIEGGGRFFGISSPAPGFFHRMVFDAINDESMDDVDESLQGVEVFRPMKGVRIWRNGENKFWVIEPHWKANPDKSQEIQDSIRASMPESKYQQEYELNWKTYSGKKVYELFDPQVHYKENLEPDYGLPLILGFDFGLTPACLVAQLQGERLIVLREYVEFNMGIERFLKTRVIPGLKNDFPRWPDVKNDFVTVIDPSGFFRKDTDENTCARIMTLEGFRPQPGPVTWEERKGAVDSFLSGYTKWGPNILINKQKCPTLAKGFEGGYQWPKKVDEIQPDKVRPVKNIYSHIHDAMQYVASCATFLSKGKRKPIPKPGYAWSQVNGHDKLQNRNQQRSKVQQTY